MGACASQPKNGAPDAPLIRALDITGNRALSTSRIKSKILTSKTGWWPFATKRYFDPISWQSDLSRIERLYETRGFYQAEVVKDEVIPRSPGAVALKITLSEGPPTRIGTITLTGLEALPADQQAKVTRRLPLQAGAIFIEPDWEAAKSQVHDRLRGLGYANARVDADARIDVDSHLAALTILAKPGPRFFFSDIQVKATPEHQIPDVWVWEQVRLAIPTGDPFSDEALNEAQRRVSGMGVFATVKVTAGQADPQQARIPVLVDVREAPFHTLRLGGGAHFDEVRNEVRLLSEWTHRNFYGGMRKLTVHVEAGWAFIPNAYAVATDDKSVLLRNGPVARAGIGFEQPRLFGRPSLRERSSIDLERTLEPAYNLASARLSNGVVWQPRASLSIFPVYRLEVDYLDGPPLNSAASAPLTLGCVTSTSKCLVWLSYLEQLLTWDRRDNRLEPRNGFYASLSLQEGGGPLGGDFDYFRVLPDVRGYVTFGEDKWLTLSTRLRMGDLWTASGRADSSAVVTRFYAGGAVSMRGFNDRRLSPLLEAPAPVSPGVAPTILTLPIGGNGLIDGSFEARVSLTQNLRLAVFVDYGQVSTGSLGPDEFGHLLWAVGVGVRYMTPIGPIRVDLARRLQRGRLPPLYMQNLTGQIVPVSYQVNTSCFGIGGTQPVTPVNDNLCVLHISIGEAF